MQRSSIFHNGLIAHCPDPPGWSRHFYYIEQYWVKISYDTRLQPTEHCRTPKKQETANMCCYLNNSCRNLAARLIPPTKMCSKLVLISGTHHKMCSKAKCVCVQKPKCVQRDLGKFLRLFWMVSLKTGFPWSPPLDNFWNSLLDAMDWKFLNQILIWGSHSLHNKEKNSNTYTPLIASG